TESKDNRAADLLLDDRGVDGLAAISGANHLVDFHLPLIHRDFRHLRREAADVVHDGDAMEMPGWQRLAPTCFLRRQIQDSEQTRRTGKQPPAHFDRIPTACRCELIEE